MTKLKLIQWNVWYKEPIQNMLTEIKRFDADVYCLQELTIGYSHHDGADAVKSVAEATGFNHYFHSVQNSDDGAQANAIFSRYPITESRNDYINEPEGSGGYDDEYRTYVEAKLDVDGAELTVGTTHMSYTDRFVETLRKLSEYGKLEASLSTDKKFVFTGDLNVTPDSEVIKRLQNKLRHIGPSYGEPTWTTKPFSYNGFTADTLDWRLDYVFATEDVKVTNSKILETDKSDHLPILIELEV